MNKDRQLVDQLRNEVMALRRRVSELEVHVAETAQTAVAVQQLENPFVTLFQTSPVAVVITSIADERYIDVNDYFANITGYTRQEVLGRTSRELQIWADLQDRVRVGQMLTEQPVVRDIELIFRTKSGTLRTVIASLALIEWQGKRCVLTMCHDITERKQIAAEHERLLNEAQAGIRIRDEFLSVAAHELKTPLTALQLYIDGMQRLVNRSEPQNSLRQRLLSKFEIAGQQVVRLAQLVNNLLDVTRIREGRLELDLVVLDLAQIVQTVVERFEAQLEQAQSPVRLDLTPALIMVDQSRLEQIITNLLSNAIKYGAGQLIEVQVRAGVETVDLVVSDHGIGIASGDQERIFARFERAVSADHYAGLGLGLYVVHQLVSALNGRIEVTSVEGQGATFTVTFPRVA